MGDGRHRPRRRVGDVGTAAVATVLWLVAFWWLCCRFGRSSGAGRCARSASVGRADGAYSVVVNVKADAGVPLADRLLPIVERDDVAELGDRQGSVS